MATTGARIPCVSKRLQCHSQKGANQRSELAILASMLLTALCLDEKGLTSELVVVIVDLYIASGFHVVGRFPTWTI